jgi:hypothetical protein
MKIPSIGSSVCFMITLLATRVDAGTLVLDQSFVPPHSGQLISVGTTTNGSLAQTFTVGVAGTLERFDAYVAGTPIGTSVQWDILPTVDGIPVMSDSAALASGSFLSSAAPQNGFSLFPISLGSSSISVSPGEVLAIVFRTAPGFNGVSLSWEGQSPNPYAGGYGFVGVPVGIPGLSDTAWSTSYLNGYDLGFQTWVEPVPEPSTALLILVGACLVVGIRNRAAA